MATTEMQQITVAVPAARVPEFYEMFGRWLRAADVVQPEPEEEAAAPIPFGAAPVSTVASWWRRLSEPARRIFLYLAAHPEKHFDGAELAAACNIDRGPAAVAGTLSWPGTYAARANLEFPVGWDKEQQKYVMSAAVAKVIKAVARGEGG